MGLLTTLFRQILRMRQISMAVLASLVAVAAFTSFTSGRSTADYPKQAEARTENKLVGTWKMVKAKFGGKDFKISEGNTQLKHVTPTHYMFVDFDKHGNVFDARGGPYTLKGEKFEATPEYGVSEIFKGLKGRHAGIIFAHPGGADRNAFLPEALTLARAGAVSLLIDDPSARPAAWRRRMFIHTEPENDRATYIQAIIDLRRGVDLLAARPDVDAKRLGFVGFSFGADLGGILAGIERRIKAYALMGTGARLTDLWRSGDTPQLG